MAVTIFGPPSDHLFGKTIGAAAVASAGLVGSLKSQLLTGNLSVQKPGGDFNAG